MKKLDVDKHGHCHKYLIERGGDLVEAINHFKPRAGLQYKEGFVLIIDGSVIGVEKQPSSYPYVAVLEADDERNYINCVFVKAGDFTAEPEAKDNLYEFSFRRTDTNSPYTVREAKYQIVARDPFEAHMRLGQVYHREEAYTLEVISWQQIHAR